MKPTFASARDAKAAGWFSRRHQTNDAHREAQEEWRLRQKLRRERERESIEATAQRGLATA